jgi:hypothetical protein
MNDHGMLKGSTRVVRSIRLKSMVASLNHQSIINMKPTDWNHRGVGDYMTSSFTTPWTNEKIIVDHGRHFKRCLPSTPGHYGRASTSSFSCVRLLGLDEFISRIISSILSWSNLSALWTASGVLNFVNSEWQRSQQLRVEAYSRSRNGRPNRHRKWVGRPLGSTRLGPLWLGLVAPSSVWVLLSFWI